MGSAKGIGLLARAMRFMQTGRITAYALSMILGVFGADELEALALHRAATQGPGGLKN